MIGHYPKPQPARGIRSACGLSSSGFSEADVPGMTGAHLVSASQLRPRSSVLFPVLPDALHMLVRKLRALVSFPMRDPMPVPGMTVPGVVGVGPRVKVIRVDTASVVAVMEDQEPVRDGANMTLVIRPVGANLAAIVTDASVSIPEGALPLPAPRLLVDDGVLTFAAKVMASHVARLLPRLVPLASPRNALNRGLFATPTKTLFHTGILQHIASTAGSQ